MFALEKPSAYLGQVLNMKQRLTASDEPNCKTPSGRTGTSTIVYRRRIIHNQLNVCLKCNCRIIF